jgi:hypothetical protein
MELEVRGKGDIKAEEERDRQILHHDLPVASAVFGLTCNSILFPALLTNG